MAASATSSPADANRPRRGFAPAPVATWRCDRLARKLKLAHTLRSQVLNLTITERQLVLAVVEDPRSGLEDLRELLVANQAWRLKERL